MKKCDSEAVRTTRPGWVASSIAVLLVMTAVLAGISLRTFRWEPAN